MLPGSALLPGALLALGFLVPTAAAAQAEEGTTTLTVEVRDVGERPLAGARVELVGRGARAVTDATGRARLEGVGGGSTTIAVQLLGYSTARATMILPRTGAAAASFALEPDPVRLAAVDVVAPAPHLPLAGTGFYTRRKAGIGTFLTRADIESARPRSLSDFIRRRVSGVELTPGIAGTAHASMRGNVSRDCPIQFYLDGAQTLSLEVDDVKPYDVEGLEIYRGAASVPAVFNKGTAACGTIVVWTKGR